MKDQRFLPVEKREPVEESEDYADDDSDELFIGGDAEAEEFGLRDSRKTNKDTLYVAS